MARSQKKLVLLDAHAIIHRAYHALPDFSTRSGIPTGAIFGFASMILRLIGDMKPDYVVACYDLQGKTFRHEAFDGYKGTRGDTDDALKLQFDATREICEAFAIPIYDAAGFEADDILGTITSKLKTYSDVDIVIASGDMDTLQLVDGNRVQVFTLKKGLNDTVLYNEDAVRERFGFEPLSIIDFKALRGDTSDNIPGIKGIGEKAATLAIQHFKTIESLYAELEKGDQKLREVGLTSRMIHLIREGKEDAEFSKILATIRTDAPIDFHFPDTFWKTSIDIEQALLLFEKYELRSLAGRLRALLGVDEEVDTTVHTFTEEALRELSLKLWLIDSDETDADLARIQEYTKEKDFEKAQQKIETEFNALQEQVDIFHYIEQPLMHIVKHMQEVGILIDTHFFADLSREYKSYLESLETKIFSYVDQPFNIKSPKQLSGILFEQLKLNVKGIKKSKTGAYSTNIDVLEKLLDEHPIIPLIMEYREFDKLLSTYIDVIPAMVGEDGRLHAEFLQNGTVTGRFSSRNPNLQNIPTRTESGRKIREGFIARKGSRLVSLDYSQIELRCLAILSKDEALMKIFNEHDDIHTAVAALIGGVSVEKVDRDMRRKAKIVNFGILYGMGINSLKKEMNVDRAEAQKFYDGFFEQFPQATAYLEYTKEFARTHGYTQTLFGRRRQFKNIHSKLPFIRAMAERMALNAPIQGTSADMIKLAMVHIDAWITQEKLTDHARLVLQIHDEIIYEVDTDILDRFKKEADTLMEQVLQNSYLAYTSPVPLVVHTSSGENWGELK